MKNKRKRWPWLLLCFPAAALLLVLAEFVPGFAEWYATGPYRVISHAGNFLSGLFPFSLAEVLVAGLVLFCPAWLVWRIVLLIRKKGERKRAALSSLSGLACTAGILFLLFTVNCGVNYSRDTFAQTCGLPVQDSSQEELEQLCTAFVEQLNGLRPGLEEDAGGVMTLTKDFSALGQSARQAFDTLAAEYPLLTAGYGAPKPVVCSRLMSWCNITGVFFPFTFEANVNTDVPDYSIPSTMCHELSHLRGFMREDEANFIGYLACTHSEEDELRYSGYMLAFIYANNVLYSADAETASQIYSRLDEGVRRDLAANSAYWAQFEGPVAEISSAVNDTYLKVNRQEDGVKSYGRMVDLLLAEQRAGRQER